MTAEYEWTSHDEAETERFGRELAVALEPGIVVALVGDLGAGKTRLVQAIAVGLGVDPAEIQSPTFVLVREYEGRTPAGPLPIHHFDTYRLRDVDEFLELGAEEMFAGNGLCLVEWADRVTDVLPPDTLRVEIVVTGPNARRFCLRSTGPRSAAVLTRLGDGDRR